MRTNIIIWCCLVLPAIHGRGQDVNTAIQKGNDLYRQGQFDKAEAAYKEASDADKTNTTAPFNRANAMIRQEKKTEAAKLLDEVIMNTSDPVLKGKAYYNKGVMLSGQQRLEESIEAYKNSLRQNPHDNEARENLQKALLELKKKTPPPPKKENKKNQQKKQQQPKMDEKEAEQRLQLLDQKEKEIQQRMQQAKTGVGQQKDW